MNYTIPELPRYENNGTFPFDADYWYDSRIKKDAMVKVTAFRKGIQSWKYEPCDVKLALFKVYDFKTPDAYIIVNNKTVKLTDMRILR